jgi:hypothetical protein
LTANQVEGQCEHREEEKARRFLSESRFQDRGREEVITRMPKKKKAAKKKH